MGLKFVRCTADPVVRVFVHQVNRQIKRKSFSFRWVKKPAAVFSTDFRTPSRALAYLCARPECLCALLARS